MNEWVWSIDGMMVVGKLKNAEKPVPMPGSGVLYQKDGIFLSLERTFFCSQT
jgi:hypothetical protein